MKIIHIAIIIDTYNLLSSLVFNSVLDAISTHNT